MIVVFTIYDHCDFAPAKIPSLFLYQLPPESCLGLVSGAHPHAQHKEAVHPGVVPVAAPRELTAKRFPQLSLPQHPQQSLFFRPKNTSAGKIIYGQKKQLSAGLGRAGACLAG